MDYDVFKGLDGYDKIIALSGLESDHPEELKGVLRLINVVAQGEKGDVQQEVVDEFIDKVFNGTPEGEADG